jgi:energy-coupling factor transporter ATP-binding protein EcfA2
MDLRQVQSALLDAFNGEELRQLAAIELGVPLEQIIPDGGTLTQRALDLIEWANRENRLAELVCGAFNRKGSNSQVMALVDQAVRWPECAAAGMVVQDGRASCFAPRVKELVYLDELLADYDAWAKLYTPLPGDVEAPVGGRRAPKLLAPDSFLPQEFDTVATHEFGAQTETKREAVDDLRKAVAQHNRLVVLGDPGSGKTTTLQMLRREYAQAAKADSHAPLPVLVTLGGYTGAEPPLDYIMRSAGSLGPHLLAYLKAGRAVLLLDALNEMPQNDYRERVKRIKALLDRFRDAPVLVTCRALNYIEELNLGKLKIRPLDERRQREYLRRYLGDEDGDALFWRLAGGLDVAALWATWQKAGGAWEDFWQAEKMPDAVYKATSISQDGLWRDLRSGKLAGMLALSVNPYMLAMLIKVYVEGAGVLPQNRAQLFDAFVRVLLARERKRADSRDWPSDEPLRAALGQLAYTMQQAGERGTAVDQGWAAQQFGVPGLSADAALYWARSATLLEASGDAVRFVHQLVQEYFAASEWRRRFEQGDDLASYWSQGWLEPTGWEETAMLLAGMLPDMTPFVEKLTLVNPVLAARCIAESGGRTAWRCHD